MKPKAAKIAVRRRSRPMRDMVADLADIFREMPLEAKKPMDKGVAFLVALITGFGVLMIWSASMYNAKLSGNEFYYVEKQLQVAAIGFVAMYVMSLVNYQYLRRFAFPFLALALGLLVVVLFTAEDVNGAGRWLRIFGFVIQPAELAKAAVMMFVAREIERKMELLPRFSGFLILLSFTGVVAVLIYMQPALSTAIIVAGLIIGMYFMAGGNLLYIALMGVISVSAIVTFIASSKWRMARILAYQNPWSDLAGKGWQPAQSLMALGSGGIFGQGIGNGKAKLMFLPEPQNDYIFSVIGEELGLIGCVTVILVYFFLVFRLIKIALGTSDVFGRLLASGMGLLIAIQVFLNIAVVTNLIPPTGVMLPFISAGGSSLLTMLFSMGIVLNISRNVKSKT
ncbi:MAG: putative lipid II flippase FtsW [Eubacteriaceae bacterium]|jgi:cell division protein FtsW|nr:putative lipid II flippase FtsW [Eubacteriaceae bacterium]